MDRQPEWVIKGTKEDVGEDSSTSSGYTIYDNREDGFAFVRGITNKKYTVRVFRIVLYDRKVHTRIHETNKSS